MHSELLAAIAGIAGVFVGFGALIGLTRRADVDAAVLGRIRAVVTIGLVVIVAALVPIVLDGYGLSDQARWRVSSLVFLGLVWAVIVLSLRAPENRGLLTGETRGRPLSAAFFWLALEIPIQAPLIVAVLDLVPDRGQALYMTALAFNLFEAAFVLAQLVYDQVDE